MAGHAPVHGHPDKRLGGKVFALSDLSVTNLTFDLPENNMPSVRIKDVVRLPVNLPPWNGFPSLGKLPDLFFFRILGDGLFVAFQADG
jgi:hypothetical protein